MTRSTICGMAVASCVLTGPVAADILLLDLEDPQQYADFFTAVETWTVLASYDFDSLPDFGAQAIDGPLTSEGSGPAYGAPFTDGPLIPPGLIPDGITIDSNLEPFGEGGPSGRGPGGAGMAGIGPNGPFGVSSNTVLAAVYIDSFDIIFTPRDFPSSTDGVTALVFTGVTLVGTDTMSITVYDSADQVVIEWFVDAPPAGHTYGLLAVGTFIGRVNFWDRDHDVYGAEGVMGEMTAWGTAALCPADLDGDGIVGVPDLLSLLASWGPCKGCPADFDGDDDVGVSDLLVLLANWGPCP